MLDLLECWICEIRAHYFHFLPLSLSVISCICWSVNFNKNSEDFLQIFFEEQGIQSVHNLTIPLNFIPISLLEPCETSEDPSIHVAYLIHYAGNYTALSKLALKWFKIPGTYMISIVTGASIFKIYAIRTKHKLYPQNHLLHRDMGLILCFSTFSGVTDTTFERSSISSRDFPTVSKKGVSKEAFFGDVSLLRVLL